MVAPRVRDEDDVKAVLGLIRYGHVGGGPRVASASVEKRFRLGPCRLFFCTDVQESGRIAYEYVLAAYVDGSWDVPTLVISSEKATDDLQTGSHFFVVTRDGARANRGRDDRWREQDAFLDESLKVAGEVLGIEGAAVDETPKPAGWTKDRPLPAPESAMKPRHVWALVAAGVLLVVGVLVAILLQPEQGPPR